MLIIVKIYFFSYYFILSCFAIFNLTINFHLQLIKIVCTHINKEIIKFVSLYSYYAVSFYESANSKSQQSQC